MEDNKQTTGRLENISYKLILAVILIAPIFFFPFLSLEFAKAFVVLSLSSLAIILASKSFFSRTSIGIPRQPFMFAVLLLPCVFLLSALVTTASICKAGGTTGLPYPCFPTFHISLVGYGFEAGTVGAITIASLLMFLVASLFRSKEKIFYAELLFLFSVGILVIFQILHLLIPAFTLGLFFGATSNLFSRWNDLALFVGSGVVMALTLLTLLPLSKLFKTLVFTLLALSLLTLLVINYSTAWVFVAIFSLILTLYSYYEKGEKRQSLLVTLAIVLPVLLLTILNYLNYASLGSITFWVTAICLPAIFLWRSISQKKYVPIYSVVIAIISICAVVLAGPISQKLPELFNINNTEVNPSWSATLSITKEVFKQNLFFGTGPNKFINAWQLFRPNNINNETVLWNSDFDYGRGTLPTFIATTGLLGLLAILFLLGSFVWLGIKILRLKFSDAFSGYTVISSYLIASYFWMVSIFYVTSIVSVFFAFIFSGFSLATYYTHAPWTEWTFVFGAKGKKRFVYVLKITAISSFVLCVGIYFTLQAFASTYFQRGLKTFGATGDRVSARDYITKAANLIPNDFYYRALTDLSLADVNSVLTRKDNLEAVPADFQNAILLAEKYATKAVEYNPRNFRNWIELAFVYEAVVPTGNEQAYQNTIASYREAINANPKNPGPFLRLARLEAGLGSFDKAREYANIALQIKPNFSEVAFLLSQIEVETKNVDGAIKTIQNAITANPNDPLLYFQLGLLRYDRNDYKGSVNALDQAIVLVPDYANAKYFRGLSLSKLGEREKALADFTDILKSNPENQEIKFIISNLENRRDPFANALPPIDNEPEKREELPVKEQ